MAPVTEKEEDFHIDSEVHFEGAHPLCGTLSWQGLNPIKLPITASSPGNMVYC